MKFQSVQSIEDLKQLGSIKDLVEQLQKLVTPLKVEAKTYEEVFEIVCTLQKSWLSFAKGPFISKQAEYVYYLTQLEGKQRNDAIGITDQHYDDLAVAKKWFKELAQLVHPDKGGNSEAFDVLKKLYDVMVDLEDDADV